MEYRIQALSQLKPLLQSFRKKAGLTQAAMAEQLGMSQQGYAQIESNLATTSVERLYTILRLLNVDLHFATTSTTTEVNENSVGDQGTETPHPSPKVVNQGGLDTDIRKGHSTSEPKSKSKKIEPPVEKKRAGISARKISPTAKAAPKKITKRADTSTW